LASPNGIIAPRTGFVLLSGAQFNRASFIDHPFSTIHEWSNRNLFGHLPIHARIEGDRICLDGFKRIQVGCDLRQLELRRFSGDEEEWVI
jgi:ABC-type thiamine transport system ATPase subunit